MCGFCDMIHGSTGTQYGPCMHGFTFPQVTKANEFQVDGAKSHAALTTMSCCLSNCRHSMSAKGFAPAAPPTIVMRLVPALLLMGGFGQSQSDKLAPKQSRPPKCIPCFLCRCGRRWAACGSHACIWYCPDVSVVCDDWHHREPSDRWLLCLWQHHGVVVAVLACVRQLRMRRCSFSHSVYAVDW